MTNPKRRVVDRKRIVQLCDLLIKEVLDDPHVSWYDLEVFLKNRAFATAIDKADGKHMDAAKLLDVWPQRVYYFRNKEMKHCG